MTQKMETLNYQEYTNLINELVEKGETTGSDHSQKLIDFTKLNQQRMNRLKKTLKLNEKELSELANIKTSKHLLVIGEAWCGDCAQIIPVLNSIVEASNGKLTMEIISREVSPLLIEKYGVNGIISIPKVLIYDDSKENLMNVWGTRPKPALEILKKWKENKDTISHEQFEQELHLWYARDKGKSIVGEILEMIV